MVDAAVSDRHRSELGRYTTANPCRRARWRSRNGGQSLSWHEGLLFHGVDASISAGADYAPSRALALALHEDYPDLDGLAYRSRHNNGEVCYALFDRVLSSDLVTLPGQRFEDDPARTDQLMRLHGAVFDTSLPIT
ncbi:RES domain-containing protein [Sinorhizobium meliloti]|nr:RES domain-containing protein [Sinorhizobium meliloti]MQX60472.1 RES domain-containing protein [Sinorhizobium meliloti]